MPQVLKTLFACILGALVALPAAAQTYPSRAVKIIVPYSPGGPADIYGRVLAERMDKSFGQPFVVENRVGGGAVIGTDFVAKSEPDGYTLLVMSNTHAVNETLLPKKPYQLMRDLAAVAPVNYSDLLLVVHPSLQATNVKELIALAKSKPGVLNYASSGPGTPYHMAGELFKFMAGVDIVHIPHKGSSGARQSIMGGQVDLMFDAITTMAGTARAGKVRALATTGNSRSTVMPELPTVSEAGVPGYEAPIWLGVMAPKATPRPIIDRLNGEIRKIVATPDIKAAWAKQGAVPMSMSPDEFEKYLHAEIEKWGKVVKASGMKVE
jgi:tripartite-type tricarboxylate transporter receptor subunit TctC